MVELGTIFNVSSITQCFADLNTTPPRQQAGINLWTDGRTLQLMELLKEIFLSS